KVTMLTINLRKMFQTYKSRMLLLIIIPGLIQACNVDVSGDVIWKKSDSESIYIPGAKVVFTKKSNGEHYTTISAESTGRYELKNLPEGDYTVNVYHDDYKAKEPRNTAVLDYSSSSSEEIDMYMIPKE
ncbi:MAG: carboxypeptidase-like regulatory domain-containing protein, partial [Spirochaetota bacterium]